MTELGEVTLERRFCGPPTSANGGYAAGSLARFVPGPARVRLVAAPPLDVPLAVRSEGGRAELRHGEVTIAFAEAAEVDLVPPAPVTLAEAERAARGSAAALATSPYRSCFVCGARDDGLHIHPGAVPGREVLASSWHVEPWLADDQGRVPDVFLWSALDCPGGWAADPSVATPLVLGTMTARVVAPVTVGERLVTVGWSLGRDGRKHHVGSAVFDAGGALRALARSVWIALEPSPSPSASDRRATWG